MTTLTPEEQEMSPEERALRDRVDIDQTAEEQRQTGSDFEDFVYDTQQDQFWCLKSGRLIGRNGVNAEIPLSLHRTEEGARGGIRRINPSVDISNVETGSIVSSATWWPGKPQLPVGEVYNDGMLLQVRGKRAYNMYIPPDHSKLKAVTNPDQWIEHVKMLYPEKNEHETFFNWAAHALQRPGEKTNFHPILSGKQGIGKDLMLYPIRIGVGVHNTQEIGPDEAISPYTPFYKSVLLVINEMKPHNKEMYASNMYDALKPMLAAPPDMLPMRRLYMNPVYVANVMHVVITTNDALTIHIPEEDRRLFVMHSRKPTPEPDLILSYYEPLWEWLRTGGADAVISWLLKRDISEVKFQGRAPNTHGKDRVIDSTQTRVKSLTHDIVEHYIHDVFGGHKPDVIFLSDLSQYQANCRSMMDKEKPIARQRNMDIAMAEMGYATVRKPAEGQKYKPRWDNYKTGSESFKSTIAFIKEELNDHVERIEWALHSRPLKIEPGAKPQVEDKPAQENPEEC